MRLTFAVRELCLGVALAVLATLTVAGTSRAATFTVDSFPDQIDANPGDGVCATGLGTCTLRAAIQEANALPGRDTLELLSGVYELSTHHSEALDEIVDDIEIMSDADDAVIQGSGGGFPGDFLVAAGVTAEFHHVTIRNTVVSNEGNILLGDVTLENGTPGGLSNQGVARITDSLVQHNGFSTSISNGADLTISRTAIVENVSSEAGPDGAIRNFGSLVIEDSVIARNHSGGEGAGAIGNYSGTLTIRNTTISGNGSGHEGPGAIANQSPAPVALINCTITDNSAVFFSSGGGLRGSMMLRNTILAGNYREAENFPDPSIESDCGGATIVSEGYNLIGQGDCVITGDSAGNLLGVAPGLASLANNRGPTLTHALLPGSPARNAGNPASPGTGGTACEATDQRGSVRPGAGRCDIGAFEEASCGDGVQAISETCDDGNILDGDCCSATCQRDADGSPCSDGNACTANDSCDGGVCIAGPPVDCGACETCNTVSGCNADVRPACHRPTARLSSQLTLQRQGPKLQWQWAKGDATTLGEFGNPLGDDPYALCLFDESGSTPRVAFRALTRTGSCGKKPCWKAANARSFKYTDRAGTPDGLDTIQLKAGATDKAKVLVAANGAPLEIPPLPLALPARMQLQAPNGQCWEARYFEVGASRNDARRFKGKTLGP